MKEYLSVYPLEYLRDLEDICFVNGTKRPDVSNMIKHNRNKHRRIRSSGVNSFKRK
jgi:hypothetical protein